MKKITIFTAILILISLNFQCSENDYQEYEIISPILPNITANDSSLNIVWYEKNKVPVETVILLNYNRLPKDYNDYNKIFITTEKSYNITNLDNGVTYYLALYNRKISQFTNSNSKMIKLRGTPEKIGLLELNTTKKGTLRNIYLDDLGKGTIKLKKPETGSQFYLYASIVPFASEDLYDMKGYVSTVNISNNLSFESAGSGEIIDPSKSFYYDDIKELPNFPFNIKADFDSSYKINASTDSKRILFNNPLNIGDKIDNIYIYDARKSGYPSSLIETEVIAESDHAIALVDITTEKQEDNVTGQELKTYIEDVLNTYEKVIYNRELDLFGEYPKINPENKLIIIFSSAFSAKESAFIGYHESKDLYYRNNSYPHNPLSNEAAIIYVLHPTPRFSKDEILATIAHECLHLITYNESFYKDLSKNENELGGTYESHLLDIAIEEGVAHFSEDIIGFSETRIGIPYIVNQTLTTGNISKRTLFSSTDNLVTRGFWYLFIQYITEQFGGLTYNYSTNEYEKNKAYYFINNLIRYKSDGLFPVLQEYYTNQSDGRDFSCFFMDFITTIVNDEFDNEILNSKYYNYNAPYNDELTDGIHGIDLSSTRYIKYNDKIDKITFDGPSKNELSSTDETFYLSAGGYIIIKFTIKDDDPEDIEIKIQNKPKYGKTILRLFRIK